IHKANPDIYQAGVNYLKFLEDSLLKFEEALCENLLDRLEKAHANKNIYYSDNLYSLIQELNRFLDETQASISFPNHARQDLSSDYFEKAQTVIRSFGTQHQINRLNLLSWNSGNDEYTQLTRPQFGIQVVPNALSSWLIQRINRFWYWLSAAYRYRVNFLKQYAHLIAQQKLLEEHKNSHDANPHTIKNNQDLKILRALEAKMHLALSELNQAELSEKRHFVKSKAKLALISAYQAKLKQSLGIILSKKITILAKHAEHLKIYVYAPELRQLEETRYAELYQTDPIRSALLELYQEIEQTFLDQDNEKSHSLRIKFNSLSIIIKKFYDPESANAEVGLYTHEELEHWANTSIANLLTTNIDRLRLSLECYQKTYSNLITSKNLLLRKIAEKSLYQLVFNYLRFINSINHYTETDESKLSLIENTLLAINPILVGYLKEIQILRQNAKNTSNVKKLKLQISSTLFGIEAEIKKHNLGLKNTESLFPTL
ncbi:MAG TPA: hypothetical protein VD770_01190, partial [Coxiellaceae bacterium]|nr:hypothetical protein [Coxiellaceae bacterium]